MATKKKTTTASIMDERLPLSRKRKKAAKRISKRGVKKAAQLAKGAAKGVAKGVAGRPLREILNPATVSLIKKFLKTVEPESDVGKLFNKALSSKPYGVYLLKKAKGKAKK